jgi:hypothetical protein
MVSVLQERTGLLAEQSLRPGMAIPDLDFWEMPRLEELSLGQMECLVEIYLPMASEVLAVADPAECTEVQVAVVIQGEEQVLATHMEVVVVPTIQGSIRSRLSIIKLLPEA